MDTSSSALVVALLGFFGVVLAPLGPVLVGRYGKARPVPDPEIIVARREYDALVSRMADMDAELHRECVEHERTRRELATYRERAIAAELTREKT